MNIKFWGARGSIPVSGKEYLKYGGATTCVEIETKDKETIIIDAGSGIRKLGNKLVKENKRKINIIFTHSHWDHVLGFPFFKPLYVNGTNIQMYGCPFTQESIKRIVSETMNPPYFPVNFNNIKTKISYNNYCEKEFMIGTVKVMQISLSHPNQGMGYKFSEDGKNFVFLTDNELTYKHNGGCEFNDYKKFCENTDLLVHDAEYTEEEYKFTKTWGHSVYTDALKLAMEANVKKFVLWHHNQERTDEQLDNIVSNCQNIIKKEKLNIDCFAATEEMEIEL
ncbi:MAG: metal-dependent hydrolase [Elusimicrobia bacterium RIFOXYD2_FULL_34_15]|nr:MAG: metal-dependent hydrolase [Elusimicrobia bacterium RIFOXYD2_FULL_34_15]